MPLAPVIGVPCGLQYAAGRQGTPRHGVSEPYVRALSAVCAMPVLVPLVEDEMHLRSAYDRLDGLVLTGGGDVDPALYGEARHRATRSVDRRRDGVELTLARWALADGMPILAICRGLQVLNVSAGGTLHQDLADQLDGALKHDYLPDYPRTLTPHYVEIADGSQLAAIMSYSRPPVNSLHHQGIKDLADGFAAVAKAPDGLIEGIEYPGHPFTLGVQWHPEELVDEDARMMRLFEAFVEATRE